MTIANFNIYADKKIVVLDDNEDNLVLISRVLNQLGYTEVVTYSRSLELLSHLEKAELAIPDLFILDIMLPELDGITLASKIREDPRFDGSYIIFLTAREDDKALEKCFAAGGQDFLTKPSSRTELGCRLSNLFKLQYTTRTLTLKNKELTYASITDGLTQIYNRAFLEQRLEEEFSKCQRYQQILSLIMLDLDFFKSVNDTYGHLIGDEVLRKLGSLLKSLVRSSDVVGRYGGEEFSILLTGTLIEQAHETAERIRMSIAKETLSSTIPSLKMTVSMGVASFGSHTKSKKDLIEFADKALYKAKTEGRNKTVAYYSQKEKL